MQTDAGKNKMVIWELNSSVSDQCATSSDFKYVYGVDSQKGTHGYTDDTCSGSTADDAECDGWYFSDFALGDSSHARSLLVAIDDTVEMVAQPATPVHTQYIWTFLVTSKDSDSNEGVGRTKLNYATDNTEYRMTSIDYYGVSPTTKLDSFIIQVAQIQKPDLNTMGNDSLTLIILDRFEEKGGIDRF